MKVTLTKFRHEGLLYEAVMFVHECAKIIQNLHFVEITGFLVFITPTLGVMNLFDESL